MATYLHDESDIKYIYKRRTIYKRFKIFIIRINNLFSVIRQKTYVYEKKINVTINSMGLILRRMNSFINFWIWRRQYGSSPEYPLAPTRGYFFILTGEVPTLLSLCKVGWTWRIVSIIYFSNSFVFFQCGFYSG